MKYQTTLIFIVLTLASTQAFARHDHSSGHRDRAHDGYYYDRNRNAHHGSRWNDRYRNDRRKNDRHGYGRQQYDRHRNNRFYGYKRNEYSRHRNYVNYGRLMNYSPDRFARWYADTAVEQIERARRLGCRFGEAKGRWRYNWNDHYRHGLKERRDTSIREVETRERELSRCNHNNHGYGYRW